MLTVAFERALSFISPRQKHDQPAPRGLLAQIFDTVMNEYIHPLPSRLIAPPDLEQYTPEQLRGLLKQFEQRGI